MRALRFFAVLFLIGGIAIVFSPNEQAWDWFMADKPEPSTIGGLILYRDEWHSALLKTRLIGFAMFIGASFVGAWAHSAIQYAELRRAAYYN